MSDQTDRTNFEDKQDPAPESAGVEQKPRGNPDVDQDAVDKGLEQLERVKPY